MAENPQNALTSSDRSAWLAEFFSLLHRFTSELRKRWWLVLLVASGGVLLGALKVYDSKPTYVSYGRLIAKPRTALPTIGQQPDGVNAIGGDFFGTQLAIINSPKITSRARERVILENSSLKTNRAGLNVYLSPGTSILQLTATGDFGPYAQLYLEAVMEEYLAYNSEQFAESSQATLDSITTELKNLDDKLRSGENRLLDFQKTNNVVFLEEQGISAGKSLAELNTRVAAMTTEYQFLELLELGNTNRSTLFDAGALNFGEDAPTTMGSEALNSATAKLNELRIEREDWSLHMKDAHPRLVRLSEEITRQERLLDIYRKQSVEQLKERRSVLALQLTNLTRVSNELELKSLESSRRMAEFERMKSEQQRHQNLYDRLLETIQTLDLSKNLGQDTFSILEHASKAREQKPDMIKTPVMGGMIGAFLGLGMVFLFQRFNDRLLTLTEVTREFDEEILTQIPLEKIPVHDNWTDLVAASGGHSFVESFRTLRSSVLYMPGREETPRTILITSALPGEGKSTVARNLAIHLAKGGAKTVLIDADLRRGNMHRMFDPVRAKGLADVLMGKMEFRDVVFDGQVANLSLCSRGQAPRDPGELFIGHRMDEILAEAVGMFDFVVVDSAPIMATDDSTNLVSKVDTAAFVFRANYTSARVARIALEQIYRVKGAVLGLVFNSVDVSRRGYNYYYNYYNYYRSYGHKE